MRRLRRVSASLLLAIPLAGCTRPISSPGGDLAAWRSTRVSVDSLLAEGRYPEAAERVARAAAYVRAPYAPAWQVRERSALAREIADVYGSPATARDSLAGSTRSLRSAVRAAASDSWLVAQRASEEALDVRRAVLGHAHPWTAMAALTEADLAFRVARPALAESLATAAEQNLRAAYGAEHPAVATALALRGRLLKNFTGRAARPQILALYHEALRIRTRTLGVGSSEVADSYHDLGNLERLCGRPITALACLRTALRLNRAIRGPIDDDVASSLSAIAVLEASQGHWASAEASSGGALAASPAASTPPASRAFRLGVRGQVLRRLGRYDEAVAHLRDAVALADSVWSLSPRDVGSTVQSGLSLHGDLALALAATGRAEEALVAAERGTSRTFAERATRAAGTDPWAALLPRVQRVLRPDEALVAWLRPQFGAMGADDAAWACVVRATGPPHWVALPATALKLTAKTTLRDAFWYEMRSAVNWPMRVPGSERDRRLASAMGAAWFEPLEPWLVGAHRLVVVSPELVSGGPLAALSDSSGRPLIDRFAIAYAPSALFYATLREHSRPWPRAGATLVVGDPGYRAGRDRQWTRLAGSRSEVEVASQSVPGATVLVGPAASAGHLRAIARDGTLARLRLLHVATHTETDLVNIGRSQLVLAPDQPGSPDSRLSASEIETAWHLDADLVCLTGCRSAAGVVAASQGGIGLQQAFLRAGARSVLTSLWPVDDAATAMLVREFYVRLFGTPTIGSRAEALRDAQRAVRDWVDPSGRRPYAHPAYWAGFLLVGDPG